jgi:hypothetical protein
MSHYDEKEVYKYLVYKLNESEIRYEIHEFTSGTIMVDIWYDSFFYVVQIDKSWAGLSKIDNDDPGFDTIPNMKFFTVQEFVNKFESIFTSSHAQALPQAGRLR